VHVTLATVAENCTLKERHVNIYVGNLSFDTKEPDLQQAFGAYGQVSEVRMIADRYTGRSKGFAFVEMPNKAEAEAAIQALNGKDLQGRTLTVNEARPREQKTGGGGFRSGGGRSGGNRW
jgi:RNA recognition motif-containing protein